MRRKYGFNLVIYKRSPDPSGICRTLWFLQSYSQPMINSGLLLPIVLVILRFIGCAIGCETRPVCIPQRVGR